MKVMQVMAGAEFGGAEAFFTRLVLALNRAGLEQRVVIRRNEDRKNILREGGVNPVELKFGGRLDFSTHRRLKNEIAAWQPDIVMSWMNRATLMTPSGKFKHVARLGGYYDLKYYKSCDHLVGNTVDIVDYLAKAGWPRERAHYLPNFVSEETAPPLLREHYFTPRDAPLILGLGRFHENKGFDVLLRAMAQLPGAYLWLAGDGPLRHELEALAEKLAVRPRTRFLGWRDDTAALFASCDVFVCPSRHEPLGNVIIEAWAQGVPVVATDSPGPGTLIENMVTGILTPVDEERPLADAISYLLEDGNVRQAMAQAGRKVFEQKFTEKVVVKRYLEFFEEITA